MQKFKLKIEELNIDHIEVEANSYNEAVEKAFALYEKDDFEFSDTYSTDTVIHEDDGTDNPSYEFAKSN